MLGRKTFTRDEIDQATAAVTEGLAAHAAVAQAAGAQAAAAVADLEPVYFNNLALALDRRFVHRIRAVTGKDGNPLNELELLAEALLLHGGVFTANKVIKLVPEQSATGIAYGEPVRLSRDQFERLSTAFLAELAVRFAE